MFESFFQGDKEEQQINTEKRSVNYEQQQSVLSSALHPSDDQNYDALQERRSDLIRWQQELDGDVFSLINTFLGQRITEDGTILTISGTEPMCNSLFIHQVVEPKLRPFISKNLINSNLDTTQILLMQQTTSNDIADMMADNWDKYGIKFVNYDGILRDIKNVMKASAWRAWKGWTKKTDSSMIKRIEQESFGDVDKKGRGLKELFSS